MTAKFGQYEKLFVCALVFAKFLGLLVDLLMIYNSLLLWDHQQCLRQHTLV